MTLWTKKVSDSLEKRSPVPCRDPGAGLSLGPGPGPDLSPGRAPGPFLGPDLCVSPSPGLSLDPGPGPGLDPGLGPGPGLSSKNRSLKKTDQTTYLRMLGVNLTKSHFPDNVALLFHLRLCIHAHSKTSIYHHRNLTLFHIPT